MSKVVTDNKHYSDIAEAIRDKGVNGAFKPSEMADAILSISGSGSGGDYNIESVDDGHGGQILNITDAEGGGIVPEGNINITDTNVTDVTQYATAQVVDANLVAENIKKDVEILGVMGELEGGGEDEIVPSVSKGVNFIDYDGTVIAAWKPSDVANKTTLPENPSHSGLTSQGWNWTLDSIKSYISKYPDALVTVGQMYITDDGNTRIYIHLEEGLLSPVLSINLLNDTSIDWGDGTEPDIARGTNISYPQSINHVYVEGGDYIITLSPLTEGSKIRFSGNTSQSLFFKATSGSASVDSLSYLNAIKKVHLGKNVDFGIGSFNRVYGLTSITIPNGITSIPSYCFSTSESLKNIILPVSVTSVESDAFRYCRSLSKIVLAPFIDDIGIRAMNECYAMSAITIPDALNTINTYGFATMYSLSRIIIPDSITDISSNSFYNCTSLSSIKFTSQTPPTVVNSNAWNSIPKRCIIYVPVGTIDAYKAATNYPSPSTYTYVEY